MSIPRVILKEESSLITKGTTPTSLGHQFTDKGVPFVRAQNLVDGSVSVAADPLFISSETNEALKRSKIQANDVLISIAGTIGRAAIVPSDAEEMNCNQAVAIVRPSDSIDRRYFLHWLSSHDALSQMAQGKVTGVISNLSLGEIGKLKIPFPSLEEQKRIAGILDQADALRRLRTRALDKLNILGQAIFHEMFGDPATNPMGWDEIKLGDFCGVGSSKRVFVSEFVEDGVPFYRGTEVGKLGTGQSINPELFISQDHYERLVQQSGKPEIGDLLLPSICHDGRIWRVDSDHPFYFKDGRVLWIKCRGAEINGEYLRNQLRNIFLHNYSSIASGTTFAELKIVNLKNLKLLYPPLELQHQFSNRIREVQQQQSALKQAENALNNFFTSLQHRAFRGEL